MTKGNTRPTGPAAEEAVVAALPVPAVITQNGWERGGAQIICANPAFCQLTGYAADELAGENTRKLHGPKTDLTLLRLGRRDTNPPAGGGNGEGWLSRKDGTPFFAEWQFRPLAGDPERLVGIYHDQSKLRSIRDALLQSQKLDTVGLLAGGLAHDFNNLLSVINGYCEIMATKITTVPAAQRDLQEIHRAGLKASDIARQILEFSRRQDTEVKVVNFNTLIREVAEIVRRVAGDDIPVELRLASDLGNARVDPTHFHQVLLNLCFNARDAMPEGGKLTIRTYNLRVQTPADRRAAEMHPGNYTVLSVTDTGHGMSPAVLNSIFEPFYTTKAQGTGLGLPTVRTIIRQSDGHVAVQTAPDRGTTFEVFLPETPEPEETSVTRLGKLPLVRGTEMVLIVEPDEVLRKMIAGILATDGYSVTDVATAEEAGAAVRESGLRPQLVMIQSCSRDGAALVNALHRLNPALRLICTSPSTAHAAPHAIARHAKIHLPKPFALSTLLRNIRTLLDRGKH